jgi:glycosyltransferase involved in cell wall biosynthesis
MKICHINTSLNNGGLENMMVDIANEQCRLGHKVAIIVVNKGVESSIADRIDKKVKIYFIGRTPGSRSVIPLIKLWVLFRRLSSFDIIHAHGIYLGKLIRKLTRIKTCLTIHDVGKDINPLKHYHKLFAISAAVKSDIEKRSNFAPVVVYNGIRTSSVKTKKQPGDDSVFKIIQVSRLEHEKKGQDVLLRALKVCIEKKDVNDPMITLDLAGDGKSMDYLKNLTHELGLSDRVTFLGNKSREWVYENLCEYDLFVQPSRYEGFGLTVVEAMAAKVPVIAAHNDGPAEVLGSGKYGFLFKNGDAADLGKQIFRVSELFKKKEVETIVEEAYCHAKNNFDIQHTAINYIQEYTKK